MEKDERRIQVELEEIKRGMFQSLSAMLNIPNPEINAQMRGQILALTYIVNQKGFIPKITIEFVEHKVTEKIEVGQGAMAFGDELNESAS